LLQITEGRFFETRVGSTERAQKGASFVVFVLGHACKCTTNRCFPVSPETMASYDRGLSELRPQATRRSTVGP